MDTTIRLHDKVFKLFIPNERIEQAIDQVAQRLDKDYAGVDEADAPIMLCTLNGAVVYAAELLKRVHFPLILKAMKMTSYVGMSPSGEVVCDTLPDMELLCGRRVLVVEDIVDTGNTLEAIQSLLQPLHPREVRYCTLLLKPEVYHKDIRVDYVALEIPNRFIVGFGLDYDNLGRNSKDIYQLAE